jgi:hypothetical protein
MKKYISSKTVLKKHSALPGIILTALFLLTLSSCKNGLDSITGATKKSEKKSPVETKK